MFLYIISMAYMVDSNEGLMAIFKIRVIFSFMIWNPFYLIKLHEFIYFRFGIRRLFCPPFKCKCPGPTAICNAQKCPSFYKRGDTLLSWWKAAFHHNPFVLLPGVFVSGVNFGNHSPFVWLTNRKTPRRLLLPFLDRASKNETPDD